MLSGCDTAPTAVPRMCPCSGTRSHAQVGYLLLKDGDFPWPIAEIVHRHHERLDGQGYPQGLEAVDILIEAKVVAVADVVEAMASHRPYRPSLGIEGGSGKIYDESVVQACLALFREEQFDFNAAGVAAKA